MHYRGHTKHIGAYNSMPYHIMIPSHTYNIIIGEYHILGMNGSSFIHIPLIIYHTTHNIHDDITPYIYGHIYMPTMGTIHTCNYGNHITYM